MKAKATSANTPFQPLRTHPWTALMNLVMLLALLSLAGGRMAMAAILGPVLTVTPNTITNDYIGEIALHITGLDSAGQTVIIEKYFDVNGSGTIDSGDLLTGRFQVTDGQVTSIAGQRNLSIPGDEDGAADAQMLVKQYYSVHEAADRGDGRFIYRVSPSGTGFAPVTANLTVTQKDYGGSGITGTVMALGSPVARGIVLFLTGGSSGNPQVVGITQADAGGHFSMKVQPGTYSLWGKKEGFIFDTSSAPTVPVAAGLFINNQDVTLIVSKRTITGTLRDAALPHAVLPGVLISGLSPGGMFSFTFADASGNFVVDAPVGAWQMSPNGWSLAQLGFLQQDVTESSAGNVMGFHFDLPRATSLIYGTLKTPGSTPVPYVEVMAQQFGGTGKSTAAITDVNGNFALGVTTASWDAGAQPTPGYEVQSQNVAVNTSDSAVHQDLVAEPFSAHLRGQVKDNHGNAVASLRIGAIDNSSIITSVGGTTDGSGNFDLLVAGGGAGGATKDWNLYVDWIGGPQNYVGSTHTCAVQDGVDINSIVYQVYVVTAHVSGQVQDENHSPVGNISIYASLIDPANPNNDGPLAISNTGVDASGNFSIPVLGGDWLLRLSSIQGLGLISQSPTITVVDGVDQTGVIFSVYHAAAAIMGTVEDTDMNPISGVQVFANHTAA